MKFQLPWRKKQVNDIDYAELRALLHARLPIWIRVTSIVEQRKMHGALYLAISYSYSRPPFSGASILYMPCFDPDWVHEWVGVVNTQIANDIELWTDRVYGQGDKKEGI